MSAQCLRAYGKFLYSSIGDSGESHAVKPELWRIPLDGGQRQKAGLPTQGTRSCGSCHDPTQAFTDGRAVAAGIGGEAGSRNTPTLVNRGYGVSFFWDGRVPDLESQVLLPIANPIELGLPLQNAIDRLNGVGAYRLEFRQIFGREADVVGLSGALASYVRSIVSGNAPLDRYLRGDRQALSPQAQLGLEVFLGKGNCAACHVGPC